MSLERSVLENSVCRCDAVAALRQIIRVLEITEGNLSVIGTDPTSARVAIGEVRQVIGDRFVEQ